MQNKMFRKITSQIFVFAIILLVQSAYVSTCYVSTCYVSTCHASEYYEAGVGKYDGYPSAEAADTKMGSGKFIEFGNAKYPTKTPDNVFDPGALVGNSYPGKDVKKKKGTGKFIMFSGGSSQYPSNYHDPADKLPMVIMNSDDAKKAMPKTVVTPSGICPLSAVKHDRDKFKAANKQKREKLLSRFDVGANYMAVYARNQEQTKPKVLGNSIMLVSTRYNSVSKQWQAKVYLDAGFICQKGYHDLELDDSINHEVSVLAIGKDVVLLQIGKQFAYLRPANADPYKFRMIWDTGIELEFDESTSGSSKIGKKSKKKSRKSKKKRRSIKSKAKRKF